MKLEFDSVEDLKSFLQWAYSYGAGTEVSLPTGDVRKLFALDTTTPGAATLSFPKLDEAPAGVDGSVGFDAPPAASEQAASNKVQGAVAPEPKRKRRTKAEIEADEKAAAKTPIVPADATPKELAASAAAQRTQPAGTVFDDKGMNPFEQPAAQTADGTAETPPADLPAEGGEADEPQIVTPFAHITRGREFIGKHGMAKYNQTFVKAGLDANVMAYTAHQRALHVAAMDELDKA